MASQARVRIPSAILTASVRNFLTCLWGFRCHSCGSSPPRISKKATHSSRRLPGPMAVTTCKTREIRAELPRGALARVVSSSAGLPVSARIGCGDLASNGSVHAAQYGASAYAPVAIHSDSPTRRSPLLNSKRARVRSVTGQATRPAKLPAGANKPVTRPKPGGGFRHGNLCG